MIKPAKLLTLCPQADESIALSKHRWPAGRIGRLLKPCLAKAHFIAQTAHGSGFSALCVSIQAVL